MQAGGRLVVARRAGRRSRKLSRRSRGMRISARLFGECPIERSEWSAVESRAAAAAGHPRTPCCRCRRVLDLAGLNSGPIKIFNFAIPWVETSRRCRMRPDTSPGRVSWQTLPRSISHSRGLFE
jgi:hypothetical protein